MNNVLRNAKMNTINVRIKYFPTLTNKIKSLFSNDMQLQNTIRFEAFKSLDEITNAITFKQSELSASNFRWCRGQYDGKDFFIFQSKNSLKFFDAKDNEIVLDEKETEVLKKAIISNGRFS